MSRTVWADRLGYVTLPTGASTLTADLNATQLCALTDEVP
jgi:hypothetical protein